MNLDQTLEQQKDQALKLVQLLASPDEGIRENASEKLLEIVMDLQELTGNEVLTALISKLKDKNENVRKNIVLAIGFLKNPKTIQFLRKMLAKDTKPVKIAAIKSLGELKSKGPVETLVMIIKKVKDVDLINEAVIALGKIRDRRTLPFLKELLMHDDSAIVFSSARVLAIMGEEEGIHFIEECLSSEKAETRKEAAKLLCEFGEDAHIPILLEKLFDESQDVRLHVIKALGNIQAEKAVPLLKAALGDSVPEIRANAAEALGNINAPDTVENLCEMLEDEFDDARRRAAESLGKLKDPTAVPYLIVLLGDEDDEVRVAACNSLMSLAFWLEDLEAKNRLSMALVVSLEDSVEAVRAAAAETLGYIDILDDEGLEALFKSLKDPSTIVVIAACASLGTIGDPRAADEMKGLLYSENSLMRWNAVTALSKLTFSDKTEVLQQMMKDQDETVREAAKLGLSF